MPRKNAFQFCRMVLAIATFLTAVIIPAQAGTFTAFGPQNYTRGAGAPVTVTNNFSVLNPNTQYVLHVEAPRMDEDQDSDSDNGDPRARARISVNGKEILDFDDFLSRDNNKDNNSTPVLVIQKTVVLLASDTIAVEVRGKRGVSITVSILGVDNDPPVITATVSPSPNAAGWNNTNVTVTFKCSDATSPVTSCPAPQTVSTEGANQIISGTATDAAGNTASTSVTLNIDKTPPAISASVSPAPNAAAWNNSNVTVSFTCSDSLSGVASCPAPATVTTEGANQLVSGSAMDVAGNSASTSVRVNLDKTPPTISISSPANGATFTSSSAAVTGTVSDGLSGVAAVTCDGAATTVQSGSFSCSVTLNAGPNTITAQATDVAGNTSSATEGVTFSNGPTITSFSPLSAALGAQVTITGSGFNGGGTAAPQVSLSQQGGGSISAPVASFTATSISFIVPSGATSGQITVNVGNQSAVSSGSLTVVPPSSFSVSASPSSTSVQQGTSISFSVSLSSNNGFSQLAALSVTGVPNGVTASFSPAQITAGQNSILSISAPANQAVGSVTLTVSAAATIAGIPSTQSTSVSLTVQAASTSLIGRIVESDNNETPIPGIIATFLGVDDAGNKTGCTGQTRSDAAGNFAFSNLGSACVGRQLVNYDGNSATDGEKYAGVNLAYTVVAGQITGPELVHLPSISAAETIMVKQNATVDQVFSYSTIPGVTVTVYAGTMLTLPDGTQPDPFPMAAVLVPVDRLPDAPTPTPGTLRASIVAFQPADTTSNQPVSVTFPNVVNTPPGVNMELDTLDPIVGELVKYGTGTVSADATQIVPDADPGHPGHRFGISHFDWHGPMAPAPNGNNPCPSPPCSKGGDPVDLSSGLLVVGKTDIAFGGARGQVAIQRTYRTLSGSPGPFGVGTNHNYGYLLDTSNFIRGTGTFLTLVTPDGNQFQFAQQGQAFINSTIPTFAGAVITNPSSGTYNLRLKNGTALRFQISNQGALLAFLNAITDANGNTTTLVRGNASQPIQITQVTDAVGRSLNLSYDNFNRILSITDPIGRTVQYTYNSQGTLSTVTDLAGGVTRYAYDSNNRITAITDARGITYLQNSYDANGRVIQQTAADGGITKFDYTLLNPLVPTSPVLVTVVTDPLGNRTQYHFNPQGFPIDITDALGEKAIFTLDPGTNKVLSTTDPLNRTTTYTYDTSGNMTSATLLAGTPDSVTSFYTYDPTFNRITSTTDPLGHVTSFTYDSSGNVIRITDPLKHQLRFAYDSNGELSSTTDALGNVTQFSYLNGDMIRITDPLGRVTSRETDAVGRLISLTNSLQQTTHFQYDALNKTTKVSDSLSNATLFSYDPNENVLAVTDANQHATSFTYDGLDRIATRTDPLGHSESYQYDLGGNPIQFTDRRGVVTKYTYDPLNRRILTSFGSESSINFSYDAGSRLVQAVDSSAGTITRSYDGLDQLISEVTAQGSVGYSYDAAGRRTGMSVSGQSPVSYSFDDAGRLAQMVQGSNTVSFSFDADDRTSTVTLPNGIVVNYTYDAASQLTAINYQLAGNALGNLTYSYDLSGRGITSVGGSFARTGLPSPLSATSYNANNQLDQFGSSNLTYDANGNLTSDGVNSYTWNARNQLVSMSGAIAASFQYDAFDRRISKIIANQATGYVYDGLIAVQELSGGTPSANMLAGGVDNYLLRTDSTGTVSFLNDLNASTVALASGTGQTPVQYTYDPFGNTTVSGNSSNSFQFTGRENDGTGLYFYRARYYSPALQRFISEDPIGFSGGSENLYAYAFNNPLYFTDATGHCPWCIIAGIGAAIGGAVEGYKAYANGCSAADIALAAARGAIAGGVGSVAGLWAAGAVAAAAGAGTAATLGAAAVGGATAGAVSDGVKWGLGGGGSIGETLVDTVTGAAFGAVASWLGPVVRGGQNFDPFTSPRTFGPRAGQAYANEANGDLMGADRDLAKDLGGRKDKGSGGQGGDNQNGDNGNNKDKCN